LIMLIAISMIKMIKRQVKLRHSEENSDKECHLTPKPFFDEYARHFQIAETQVFRGQDARVCCIYHNQSGQIIAIVPVILEQQQEKNSSSASPGCAVNPLMRTAE